VPPKRDDERMNIVIVGVNEAGFSVRSHKNRRQSSLGFWTRTRTGCGDSWTG
jgi:hypothetical protein